MFRRLQIWTRVFDKGKNLSSGALLSSRFFSKISAAVESSLVFVSEVQVLAISQRIAFSSLQLP